MLRFISAIQGFITGIGDLIEGYVRSAIIFLTNYLPVKVIRDDNGVPFLYRYHLCTLGNDGPGLCIHRFVKSDPERGYHDHPWNRALSFILCGRYDERIVTGDVNDLRYTTYPRNRWTFNYLNGVDTFHRVMVEEGKDVWTLFAFQKRSKTWGMIGLDGIYKAMSTTVIDTDGGWWKVLGRGLGLHSHLPNTGKVIATVDIIVLSNDRKKILLIRRGKDPYKGSFAFPGGRIEEKDTDLITAAYRELREETNITEIELKYHKTIGNNVRDPRGFCLTNVFLGVLSDRPYRIRAGDDAVDYAWFDLDNLPEMAFDHKEILIQLLA